jgi:predicted translin family RNA/ssDNA-binding protein
MKRVSKISQEDSRIVGEQVLAELSDKDRCMEILNQYTASVHVQILKEMKKLVGDSNVDSRQLMRLFLEFTAKLSPTVTISFLTALLELFEPGEEEEILASVFHEALQSTVEPGSEKWRTAIDLVSLQQFVLRQDSMEPLLIASLKHIDREKKPDRKLSLWRNWALLAMTLFDPVGAGEVSDQTCNMFLGLLGGALPAQIPQEANALLVLSFAKASGDSQLAFLSTAIGQMMERKGLISNPGIKPKDSISADASEERELLMYLQPYLSKQKAEKEGLVENISYFEEVVEKLREEILSLRKESARVSSELRAQNSRLVGSLEKTKLEVSALDAEKQQLSTDLEKWRSEFVTSDNKTKVDREEEGLKWKSELVSSLHKPVNNLRQLVSQALEHPEEFNSAHLGIALNRLITRYNKLLGEKNIELIDESIFGEIR